MEHKKQKKRADSGFDKGYAHGYKNANEDAYNKGYEEGNKRRFFRHDLPAVGAVAVLSHYGLIGKAENFVGSAWTFVNSLPGNAQKIICGDTADVGCINNMKKIVVNNQLKSALAVAGITLAYYIYTQVRGTPEEKAAVNRKLRQARRMTEETSDKRIKRRQTNKIKQLTKSFDSEGVSKGLSEDMSNSMTESLSESSSSRSSNRSRRTRRSR